MSLNNQPSDEALQLDSPAPGRCSGDGARMPGNIRGEDSVVSPIIKALEKFVVLCKAEKAAFRERVPMSGENSFLIIQVL